MVEIIYILLPLSLLLALAALGGFIWSVRSRQFDDVDSAPIRVIFDDNEER